MNRIIISDLLSGKTVWKYYKNYLNTQWFSVNQLKAFQNEKLHHLLSHCSKNVPYYKKLIANRNINLDNPNAFEILSQFPLLTKEIIQDNYSDFRPINSSRWKGVKTKQTGGTTGNVLFNRNDAATRSSTWATYKRYEDWMGHSAGDKVLVLMGGHVKSATLKSRLYSKANAFLNNTISVNIYDTSNETIEKVIHLLEKNNFSHIRSYPQFLFSVAKKLDSIGKSYNIKSISTTAEPVMDIHRELFRKVFNAEVYDQYGCGEIGGIAYECNKHEGLHIAEERVYIEVCDNSDLIITDLDNYTMPFIRYWNADQAIISDKFCSCGRQSKLITKVMGRTCDYVTGISGEFLHWAYFWHLIFDSNIADKRNLKKFQVVQEAQDEIVIRLVADHLTPTETDFFINDIQKRLGKLRVKFKYEHDIENTKTGKYRPVINKII